MPKKRYFQPVLFAAAVSMSAAAQSLAADSLDLEELNEVVVMQKKGIKKLSAVTNTELISSAELKRAACCNLGESFTTNPSVDVNYSDAATGARQIRLLGLSGSYVQMLTENIPSGRGIAAPFALGYIPGPWMQSIQVSKGVASVKNGVEAMTGQINVELKKPQSDPSVSVNAYYDRMNKIEANVDGNIHFNEKWSGGLLSHVENNFSSHDGNDDGFIDLPLTRQASVMPRVAYLGEKYVFQAVGKLLYERRLGGQRGHHNHQLATPYLTGIHTHRAEFFTKNALMYDRENDANVAMIISGAFHKQDAYYGLRYNNAIQREGHAVGMFERKWYDLHAISAGISFDYDYHSYDYRLASYDPGLVSKQHEAICGAYAQYTYTTSDAKLTAMGGFRYDYSDLYGAMYTPRMHLRYAPKEDLSIRVSAGRGYRSPQPLAEYGYLLASSRHITISENLHRESAWNFGTSVDWAIYPKGKKLAFGAEYYFTTFSHQLVADMDQNPHELLIFSSPGRGGSHSVQAQITFEPINTLELMAAWRFTDVKVDYGYKTVAKPLISKNKFLFTASYSPKMGIWNFDLTCAVNGPGRMPEGFGTFKAYPQLNAQITRNFRHWAVYIGGENLTNYTQPNPIKGAADPWGNNFDATMIYGPLHGANVYIGFRYNFTKYI